MREGLIAVSAAINGKFRGMVASAGQDNRLATSQVESTREHTQQLRSDGSPRQFFEGEDMPAERGEHI